MSQPDDLLPQQLRIMRTVADAIIAGAIVFWAVVLFIVQVQNQGEGLKAGLSIPILTFVSFAWLSIAGVAATSLPRSMTRKALWRMGTTVWTQPSQGSSPDPAVDTQALLKLKLVSVIITYGLLEGAAFLGCIAYLVEAQALAQFVIGWSLLCMALAFPTETRVRIWLEEQLSKITAFRQGGSIS